MTSAAKKTVNTIKHYFLDANPYRTADSVINLLEERLFKTDNPEVLVLNKPPGFQLSSNDCSQHVQFISFQLI